MMEPSYYPLSPLKQSVEGTASPLQEQPMKDHSAPSQDDTTGAADPSRGSRSSLLLATSRPQPFRKGPSANRLPIWRRIQTPLEMALFPLAAIGYLAFCYTVRGKVIPVNTYGLYAVTPQHLAAIKGGITTISIIIISIALYPIHGIVSNLKSEEFFRVLVSRSGGVPLQTINHISTPTFNNVDTIIAMWRHVCSNYYILGITVSLLMWIVATLAPGALTVESVLSDSGLMAFAIGAVAAQSVLNGTALDPAFNVGLNSETAASVAWAEMELDVQYSFGVADPSESDYAAFIAPVPLGLSTSTSARWLSDVIGINPTCSWASTNLTTPVQVPSNSSADSNRYFATAYLVDYNLDVLVHSDDLPFTGNTPFAAVKNPTLEVTNHTTSALPSDGSTVFLLGQCVTGSGCHAGTPVNLTLDLTSINTTFTIALTDQTWTMAALVCLPNAKIETREVRNDAHGLFHVQPPPAGRQLTRQGNLHPVQTVALFSITTMSLTQYAGQLSGSHIQYNQLGSQVQVDLLFGKAQFGNLPGINASFGTLATVTPAPIEDITKGYTQIIRSAAKSYLASYLGTAYVPGRVSQPELVFATSIPNLVVATAVFALLAALIILVQFRPGKGVHFTLFNVAAAVHGSELPARFAQANADACGHIFNEEVEGDPANIGAEGKDNMRRAQSDSTVDQDIVEMLGERRIFMRKRGDGSPVLHMS